MNTEDGRQPVPEKELDHQPSAEGGGASSPGSPEAPAESQSAAAAAPAPEAPEGAEREPDTAPPPDASPANGD